MRLYLVRHPKPDVPAGICYGRSEVIVSPDERGRVLASLVDVLPKQVPIYSSPALRCRELATCLSRRLECPRMVFDPRLLEMNFGTWEMRAWADIPREEIDAWAEHPGGYAPGSGETVMQMAERVFVFRSEILQTRLESAIVICHAGTIRLLRAYRSDLSLDVMARDAACIPHEIGYGQVTIMDC